MITDFKKLYAAQRKSGSEPASKIKDATYFLEKCKYFYMEYAHGQGSIIDLLSLTGPSRRPTKELRDAGKGLHEVSQYLEQVGYTKQEINKFTQTNTSYAPTPIYTKSRNIIIAKLKGLSLTPEVRAINEEANLERLLKTNKRKLLSHPQTQKDFPKQAVDSDKSPEEIEYMRTYGDIHLDVEIMAKDALDITYARSKYGTLQKMFAEDLIDLNKLAAHINIVNNQVIHEYVDPDQVIIRSSIYDDFRDSDVRGYVRQRKVSEIIQIDENAVRKNWTDLMKHYYQGHIGENFDPWNESYGRREEYAAKNRWTGSQWDFGISEVKLYWLDVDVKRYVRGRHPRGSRIFEPVDLDFQLSKRAERDGKFIEEYFFQKMYTCTWILGTDIIYDFGEVDAIVKPGEIGASQPMWPLQVYMASEPSITEKVLPFIHDINIAAIKRRDLIRKLPPGPRMIINKTAMKGSVTLGTTEYDIKEMLRMWQREGKFIIELEDEYEIPGETPRKQHAPIEFIQSGVIEDLQVLDLTTQNGIMRIQDITGINPVADGSGVSPDMLKSVMENMNIAANNAIRPTLEAYVQFKENLDQATVWMYQSKAAMRGDQSLGFLPMSNGTMKLIRLGRELIRYDLVTRVRMQDESAKQYLLQDLASKKEAIEPDVYFKIYRAIDEGDLTKAEVYLTFATKRAQELAHKRQIEVAQAQARSQVEANAAAEAQRMKQQIELLQAEVEKMRYINQFNKDFETHKSNLKKGEIKLTKDLEKEVGVAVTSVNNANRLNQ